MDFEGERDRETEGGRVKEEEKDGQTKVFGGRVAGWKMKKMIDCAVRGRSAVGQVRITDLSDYKSDHVPSRIFKHFRWFRSSSLPFVQSRR